MSDRYNDWSWGPFAEEDDEKGTAFQEESQTASPAEETLPLPAILESNAEDIQRNNRRDFPFAAPVRGSRPLDVDLTQFDFFSSLGQSGGPHASDRERTSPVRPVQTPSSPLVPEERAAQTTPVSASATSYGQLGAIPKRIRHLSGESSDSSNRRVLGSFSSPGASASPEHSYVGEAHGSVWHPSDSESSAHLIGAGPKMKPVTSKSPTESDWPDSDPLDMELAALEAVDLSFLTATKKEKSPVSSLPVQLSQPSEDPEPRFHQTMAQLIKLDEPVDTTGYLWSPDVEQELKAKQKPGTLSKSAVESLRDRGFYVTESIGIGVAGEVFKAYVHPDIEFEVPVDPNSGEMGWDVSFDRDMPVKSFKLEGKPCALKRAGGLFDCFERELTTLLLLNHPNCVRLYGTVGFGSEATISRVNFLVMEYVNGQMNFSKFMFEHKPTPWKSKVIPLDEWTAQLIIKHAVLGLEYLHNRGIIHNDFHGGNFMPHNDHGRMIWKLVDFGLSFRKGEKLFKFDDDFKKFVNIVNEVLGTAVMPNTSAGIRDIIDNIHKYYYAMEKVARALEPYFPPRGDRGEDEPPEGTVAFDFCRGSDE